ncbi:sensor domain-containing protein [Dactylosporangium sp. NBC_01737]|uniref:sensor histidine kinase n=1 Tax=Dactylosporangium sp. NBC_01737 TaxID=2975959 RepID=UPI002E165DB1|nr:sensor domain-containing protein [Dactylosporangium sp. NBC_01737]
MNRFRDRLRELWWLAVGAAIGLPAPVLLVLVVVSGPASLAAGLGVALFAAAVWACRRLAGAQRGRVAAASPYRPLNGRAWTRLRTVVGDPATWRDLLWLPCQFVAGLGGLVLAVGLWLAAVQCVTAPALRAVLPEPTGFDPAVLEWTGRSGPLTWVLVPVGAGLAVLAHHLPRHLIRGQTWLGRALLEPTAAARLTARVDRLTTTRAAAVDASAAELRRIERDLHDGAQARLVVLAMHLGVAEDVIDDDPAVAKALLTEARTGAGAALTELRSLVRGIHPPVLADRGLAAAVHALVLGSAVTVELDLRLERRLAAPVEAAAYFATAEALTNAIRHSGAGQVRVSLVDAGDTVRITVHDDGRGGADPSRGTGLLGIRRRLSAFDGSLRVSSPLGGPTVLEMELPCGS